MTSPLSGIPLAKRRQLAATLGLFAMLFIAVGAVTATGATTAVIKACVIIALVVAVLLALMAWGVLRSVRLDAAAQQLNAVVHDAVQNAGGLLCGCGHDHDADELHAVDEPGQDITGMRQSSAGDACAHDGTGLACSHSCDTCVLAASRSAAPSSGARRPSPGPRRPSPLPR